jgi:class 3 adenylate cyclase
MASVFFTGHMIDRPGRATPRFPPSRVPPITRRIESEIAAAQISDGFASGVCGGDLLFLEATLARGARAHLILPCAVEEFRQDCVDVLPGGDWGARFDRVLQRATTVEILGDQYASDNATASDCCSRIMIGLARRAAAERGEDALVLALWDGRPGDALGGTHSAVQFALQQGLPVRWMKDLAPGGGAETAELKPLASGTTSAIHHVGQGAEAPQSICAAVFADAVGFSKLRERQVPAFARHYLGCAMQALQTQSIVPLVKNTWGDGLYLVFESVRDAGLFALDFRERIVSSEWTQLGVEHAMSVRIAGHAGPLYRIYDPVLGQWSYTGAHVTRAARLEPSTEPGRVFVSVAFAALAAAEGVREFTCQPVGRRQLAKNFGEIAVFELSRAHPPPR